MQGSAQCWREARAQQLGIETWPSWAPQDMGLQSIPLQWLVSAHHNCRPQLLCTVLVQVVGPISGWLDSPALWSTWGTAVGLYVRVQAQLWGMQACLESAAISLAPSRAKMPSSSLCHPPARAAPCPRAFPKALCISFLPTWPREAWKVAGAGVPPGAGTMCLELALQSLPADAMWGRELDTTKFSHPAWPC